VTGDDKDIRLLVCVNPIGGNKPCCGGDRGSKELAVALERGMKQRGIAAEVERIHCLNRCLKGPAMRIAPGGKFFLEATMDDVASILEEVQAVAGLKGENDEPDPFAGLDGAVPGG